MTTEQIKAISLSGNNGHADFPLAQITSEIESDLIAQGFTVRNSDRVFRPGVTVYSPQYFPQKPFPMEQKTEPLWDAEKACLSKAEPLLANI